MLLTILKGWLSKAWGYVVLAGAVLAGLFALRQSGKAAGKQEIRQDINEQAAKDREKAREVDQEIDALDDSDVRNRANRWVRDRENE